MARDRTWQPVELDERLTRPLFLAIHDHAERVYATGRGAVREDGTDRDRLHPGIRHGNIFGDRVLPV